MIYHLFKTKALFQHNGNTNQQKSGLFHGSYILIEYKTTNKPIRLLSRLLPDSQYQTALPMSLTLLHKLEVSDIERRFKKKAYMACFSISGKLQ